MALTVSIFRLFSQESHHAGAASSFLLYPTIPLFNLKGLVIIDAGHGGHDFGTQSISKPLYQEKTFNLTTSLLVKNLLQQKGYQVLMTRDSDKFVSLKKRADIANEKKPRVFVSIHFNSAPNRLAEGVEVFYFESKTDKSRSSSSKKLASSILKSVLAQTKAKSRGVKHGNFAVIRETKMTAVLIESGFLTNEKELHKINDPAYINKLAVGIADGIDNFLK